MGREAGIRLGEQSDNEETDSKSEKGTKNKLVVDGQPWGEKDVVTVLPVWFDFLGDMGKRAGPAIGKKNGDFQTNQN